MKLGAALLAASSSALLPVRARRSLLRALGVYVGPRAAVASRVIIKSRDLSIGAGAFINHACFLDSGPIRIGSGTFLGPGVQLLSNDHELGPAEKRAGQNKDKPIDVGDGAWLGAGAIILGGVTIAKGCVIGAGAVVTRDTLPNGLYVGIPARRSSDIEG